MPAAVVVARTCRHRSPMAAQGAAVARAVAVEAAMACHLRLMVRAVAAAAVVAATPLALALAGPHPWALHRRAVGTPSRSCRRLRGAWRPCGHLHWAPKAPAAAGSAAAWAPKAVRVVSVLGSCLLHPFALAGQVCPDHSTLSTRQRPCHPQRLWEVVRVWWRAWGTTARRAEGTMGRSMASACTTSPTLLEVLVALVAVAASAPAPVIRAQLVSVGEAPVSVAARVLPFKRLPWRASSPKA